MKCLSEIPVCILAGGNSRRFGSPKGLAEIGRKPLLEWVIEKVQSQGPVPMAISGEPEGPYAGFGYLVVPDVLTGGVGPLAGIHAAMHWAEKQACELVVTVSGDVPFLPENLLNRLIGIGAPAVCASAGRMHPTIGIWPVAGAAMLERYVAQGGRSVHGWTDRCGAKVVDFPLLKNGIDPFFNINTKENFLLAQNLCL